MSRTPARFTQADINRAIRAAGPGKDVILTRDGDIKITERIGNPVNEKAEGSGLRPGLVG